MKHLPIGIQDFPSLIQGGYAYVDKTELIYRVAKTDFSYFLSRPRRFGKSLLVSTLKSFFEGRKELFKGTWLESTSYDWIEYPVLSLDFSRLESVSTEKLIKSFQEYLISEAKQFNIQLDPALEFTTNFSDFVIELGKQRKVVILIDEYDAPLVSELENPSVFNANKKVLHRLFTTIKSLQGHIRFAFFTGVSKFSKVSLFSGMNSLIDLSLQPEYATLLGWTEKEIKENFIDYIGALAEEYETNTKSILKDIRHWYNGYAFASKPKKVFNPWSVLNCFYSKNLQNYWFETATPTFAINLIQKHAFPAIDFEAGVRVDGLEMVANHDADKITVPSLLYQTGYLTIGDYDKKTNEYLLQFPNEEVSQSLIHCLFYSFVNPDANWTARPLFENLRQALVEKKLDVFFEVLNSLFASIPYAIHIKQESYYHSLIFLCLKLLGLPAYSEFGTSRGRIDLVVSTKKNRFLFEFKLNQTAAKALEQIKATDYSCQFKDLPLEVVLVGVNFDSKTRSINEWEVEELASQ